MTKLKKIIKYKKSQGVRLGIKGRLILLEIEESEYIDNPLTSVKLIDRKYYKPIIISETEEIQKSNKVYHNNKDGYPQETIESVVRIKHDTTLGAVIIVEKGGFVFLRDCKKIIAFPEYFSLKQLQDIVNGNLNNGDEVYIEYTADNSTDIVSSLLKSWNNKTKQEVDTPKNVQEFFKDLEELYAKHNLCISHEDTQGSFIIVQYSKGNVDWIKEAYIEL